MNREENEARIEAARDDVDRCNHGDMLVCIFPAKIERRKKGGKEQRGQVTPRQSRRHLSFQSSHSLLLSSLSDRLCISIAYILAYEWNRLHRLT